MFSLTRQILQTAQRSLKLLDNATRGLCTNAANGRPIPNLQSSLSSSTVNSPLSKKTNNSVCGLNFQSVRSYMRIYYKPRAWKRYNKHNIERRLITPSGIEVLWRRVLKGKHNLAVFERILPNTVDGKILAKHQTRFQKHPLTKQKLPKPGLN